MSPRRRPADPWPTPCDTPLDRARAIARSYRLGLKAADPTACELYDKQAIALGQGWAVPQLATYEEHDLLTVELAADLCDVQPRTIDEWRRRGLRAITTPDGVRYRVRDLVDWDKQRRERRAGHR